jgi:hypothetical protein
MKRQTDLRLIGYINKYGCFFMTIVYWLTLVVLKTEIGFNRINTWWMLALESKDENGKPILSGDMNGDGDMDDSDELLIGDKTALCRLVGLPLVYVGSFAPEDVGKKPDQYYIGEFYREWTEKGKKKSFIHFGGLNDDFECVYDPILDSNTVKLGRLKTVRVFRRTR